MDNDIFQDVLSKLADRPHRLDDIETWLFVTVNTARALIASVNKDDLNKDIFSNCTSVREVQYRFDMMQGIYGRKFSQKRDRNYNYLCSLAANFDEADISSHEHELIEQYSKTEKYLLYEI